MGLELKDYQKKALAALEGFFAEVRGARDERQVSEAFRAARRAALGESVPPLPYRPLGTPDDSIPQVCIRIPTGGGKTLLAAHAIERAARLYVGTATPLALWLVPSDIIRSQTLEALKTPGHPYREALLDHFPADRLTVLDIADCEQLRPQDFGGRTIVAVGTIQTLRVGKTASRDVYAYKEAFEPHFSALPERDWFERIAAADLEAQPYLKPGDIGKVKRSFANLLAWHRPIVIVDEAHNARSDLSFEVFRRIRPACVIEWTATPARDQNVLYHVSAQELKAESMIKLPIVLSPHPNWREAVRDAVLARQRLAEDAEQEADYIRPIVLFQADAEGGEVTVAALREHLVNELHIEEQRIAVATGKQRDLDGVNLFERSCPIDFVITIEALKEGWDCSFAYVFCTVQSIRSAKDMEQLLGRVLRLPYARHRQSESLNRAYAFVSSPVTTGVANQLADRLVAMGFEEIEAAQFVEPALNGDLFGAATAAPRQAESVLDLPPAAAAALVAALPDSATLLDTAEGQRLVVRGLIPAAALDAALAAVPKAKRAETETALNRHQVAAHVTAAPAERGAQWQPIPQLCLPVQAGLQLFEPELLTELIDFPLAGLPCDLPGFRPNPEDRPYLIDVERGHVQIAREQTQDRLDLDDVTGVVRREDVIRDLDRRVRRDDVLQADMIAWLGRALDQLEAAGTPLAYAARHGGQLAEAIAHRLDQLSLSERRRVFQHSLVDGPRKARLSDQHHFRYHPSIYPARWWYQGRYSFTKHFYPIPGELQDDLDAEETACAIEIDSLDAVKFWVRNLERQPTYSFWLPTSTDRFYPDFVAELTDGRALVVEYKGAHLFDGADSREKRDIGAVWAAASGGRCLFAMVTSADKAGRSVNAQLAEVLRR